MPRPCSCEQVDCRQCQLFHEDSQVGARFRRLWGCARESDPPARRREQIASAAAALGQAVARPTKALASLEVQTERRALCDACDQRDPETDKCQLCKCRLKGLFNKLQLARSSCPLGKWGKV